MFDLISKSQLAARLGVSVRSVNRKIARGELPPAVRLGKFSYWREPTLSRWFERRERLLRQRPR